MADDYQRPIEFEYGKKTYSSEHVGEVIMAQNLAGLANQFNDIKESKYHS